MKVMISLKHVYSVPQAYENLHVLRFLKLTTTLIFDKQQKTHTSSSSTSDPYTAIKILKPCDWFQKDSWAEYSQIAAWKAKCLWYWNIIYIPEVGFVCESSYSS